jgi:hypothetical protein
VWTQYRPVYERLEGEFCDLTFFISLDDDHLNVYSLKLAELLLQIGQECENAGKTLAAQLQLSPATGTIDRLNFPSLGDLLCPPLSLNSKSVDVVWQYQSLSAFSKSLTPFSTWSSTGSTNPLWYQAYNGLKHDRNTNFIDASFGNVLGGWPVCLFLIYGFEKTILRKILNGLSQLESGLRRTPNCLIQVLFYNWEPAERINA